MTDPDLVFGQLLEIPEITETDTAQDEFFDRFVSKLDTAGQQEWEDFITTLNTISIMNDATIYNELIKYLDNSINYNNLSFLTSLLICKMISTQFNFTFENKAPSIERNKNLIPIYLSLYTKITNTDPFSNLLTAEQIANSKPFLQFVQDHPKRVLSKITSKIIYEAEKYFDKIIGIIRYINEDIDNYTFHFNDRIRKNVKIYFDDNDLDKAKTEILTKAKISANVINSINSKLFISSLLLILIVKAIDNWTSKPHIQALIYIYLVNFRHNAYGVKNISFILSNLFVKNALTRINHESIPNMLTFKQDYFEQFKPIVEQFPFIQLQNALFPDEHFITEHERLMQTNPLYQVLFNSYDTDRLDYRTFMDNYEAIIYYIKREQALNNSLLDCFNNSTPEQLKQYHNEIYKLITRDAQFYRPFRLSNEMFKQLYDLLPASIKQKLAYSDNMNDYVNNSYNLELRFWYQDFMKYCKDKDVCDKFITYDSILSYHKFMSRFIMLKFNGKIVSQYRNYQQNNDNLDYYEEEFKPRNIDITVEDPADQINHGMYIADDDDRRIDLFERFDEDKQDEVENHTQNEYEYDPESRSESDDWNDEYDVVNYNLYDDQYYSSKAYSNQYSDDIGMNDENVDMNDENTKKTTGGYFGEEEEEEDEWEYAYTDYVFNVKYDENSIFVHEGAFKKIKYNNIEIYINNVIFDFLKYSIKNNTNNIENYEQCQLKKLGDIIALFVAEDIIANNKNVLDLVMLMEINGDIIQENLIDNVDKLRVDTVCRVIQKSDETIYDPRLRTLSHLPDVSLFYIHEKPFSIIGFETHDHKSIDYQKTNIYDINYTKIDKFLGGDNNEIIKMLFWLLIIFIVAVVIAVIIVCITKGMKNRCKCCNNCMV
mgnify:CR=1 FL=1